MLVFFGVCFSDSSLVSNNFECFINSEILGMSGLVLSVLPPSEKCFNLAAPAFFFALFVVAVVVFYNTSLVQLQRKFT